MSLKLNFLKKTSFFQGIKNHELPNYWDLRSIKIEMSYLFTTVISGYLLENAELLCINYVLLVADPGKGYEGEGGGGLDPLKCCVFLVLLILCTTRLTLLPAKL